MQGNMQEIKILKEVNKKSFINNIIYKDITK